MRILQVIGVLIIIFALLSAGIFLAHGQLLSRSWIMLLIISIITGLALIFHERAIEISFGKVATLKAAAQMASTDAEEIAAIRQRVEAQAATLDLVAKESADAKGLLGELRNENRNADEKIKLLEVKTMLAMKLAEPTTLKFRNAQIKSVNSELCATFYFEPSKNESLGELEFNVILDKNSSEKIINLWPAIEAGPYMSGDRSFQPDESGKSAKLFFQPIGAGPVAIDITLSGPASVIISGNRMPNEVKVEVFRPKAS